MNQAILLGQYNTLIANRKTENGIYFTVENEEVLLPNKFCENIELGETHKLFVYKDSLQRLVSTTQKPHAVVGEFAVLKVKQLSQNGYFLDWNLDKDLFLPFRESLWEYEVGEDVLVYISLDKKSERILASARTKKYLVDAEEDLELNSTYELLVVDKHHLGYQCIVDQKYFGMLFKSELNRDLKVGDKLQGYFKNRREDGKLDMTLSPLGLDALDLCSNNILNYLENNDGFCPLHDKSDSEEIQKTFNVSKKLFKKALGNLYRAKKIELKKDEGFSLVKD